MIVTACDNDERCFEQLLVMLMSAKENSPDDYVTVHLVECDDSHVERVKAVREDAFIERVECPEGVDRKGFMVCYRASAVLRQTYWDDYVAWFDADTIIRKDLEGFWAGMCPGGLKIMSGKSVTYHLSDKEIIRLESFLASLPELYRDQRYRLLALPPPANGSFHTETPKIRSAG